MDKKSLGNFGEECAKRFLQKRGYRIIACNVRCCFGEVDIVAEQKGVLCFIEVKTRHGDACGGPFEAISTAKQRKYCLIAQWYLEAHGASERSVRFDVVGVTIKQGSDPHVELVQDAFRLGEG